MSIKYKTYYSGKEKYECAISLQVGDLVYANIKSDGDFHLLILDKKMSYCPDAIYAWTEPVPYYLVKYLDINMSKNPVWKTLYKHRDVVYMKVA